MRLILIISFFCLLYPYFCLFSLDTFSIFHPLSIQSILLHISSIFFSLFYHTILLQLIPFLCIYHSFLTLLSPSLSLSLYLSLPPSRSLFLFSLSLSPSSPWARSINRLESVVPAILLGCKTRTSSHIIWDGGESYPPSPPITPPLPSCRWFLVLFPDLQTSFKTNTNQT